MGINLPPALAGAVRRGLEETLALRVSMAEEVALPPAFNPQRGQYPASEILYALGEVREPEELVLGLAGVDLYSPGLNFVFGQAAPGTGTAVISLFRLQDSPQLLLERAVKEAIHEVGHLLGLGHCSRRDCVMSFSNSLAEVDGKGTTPCPSCRRRLAPGSQR